MVCFQDGSCLLSENKLTSLSSNADCMFMDLNMTEVELDALPAVVSISKDSGLQLAEASQQNTTIMLWLPHYSSFDFNVVLLWVMAVGTFIVAGIWAAHDSTGNEHAYLKAEGNQEVGRLPTIELQGQFVEGWAENEAEGEIGDGIEGGVEAESAVAVFSQHQFRKVSSCSKCPHPASNSKHISLLFIFFSQKTMLCFAHL